MYPKEVGRFFKDLPEPDFLEKDEASDGRDKNYCRNHCAGPSQKDEAAFCHYSDVLNNFLHGCSPSRPAEACTDGNVKNRKPGYKPTRR